MIAVNTLVTKEIRNPAPNDGAGHQATTCFTTGGSKVNALKIISRDRGSDSVPSARDCAGLMKVSDNYPLDRPGTGSVTSRLNS
jgi:hypothetical protein